VLSLITAWRWLPDPWLWTGAVLAVIFVPPLVSALHDLFRRRATRCGASTCAPRCAAAACSSRTPS
jgi:hypothetical protein